MIDELLTPDEMAAILKIKRKRVYELPIPRQRVGRRVRFWRSALDRYLRSQEARQLLRRRASA